MAKNYGIKVADDRAEEIKLTGATLIHVSSQFWHDLNEAALEAVHNASRVRLPQGNVEFRCNRRALAMRMPSGRSLIYWQPVIKEVDTPWGASRFAVCYHAQDAVTRQWTEFASYGGIYAENLTQAVARDIMADALIRLHSEGLSPVLTVHDEAVCELPKSQFPDRRRAAEAVKSVMRIAPLWADGLPIAVDASAGTRYAKE